MRALHRRLRHLMMDFGPPVETEYSREVRRRIEAGRRRVAAARSETHVPWRPRVPIAGLTLADAIFQGRERARKVMDHSPPWFRYCQISSGGRRNQFGSEDE
jgi:hypothetical protein